MQISDFILRFPGRLRDGICRTRIFVTPSGTVFAVLSELDRNTGPSVTNAIEHIRDVLIQRGFIDDRTQIIEHYEEGTLRPPSFDRVTFKGRQPVWDPMTLSDAAQTLGVPQETLTQPAASDARLVREIEQARSHIDPHADHPYVDSPDILLKRERIRERMTPRAELERIVGGGASERELQAVLKNDLSLIGEVYGNPEEEYIAFSEFRLADGVVDFVVFSGRSRMDVTLIEAKGADFAFVNRDGRGNLSAKLNEAAQQVRERLGYIVREYEAFRRLVHDVRKDVEAGRPRFNSLVGPKGPLEVSAEKDVNHRYVVIAGRTTNDVEESRLRHNYELSFNPPIKVETWDTWLNKLRRT